MTRTILIAAAVAATFAAGAAGTVAYLHSTDPLRRADRLTETGDLRAAQVELRNAIRNTPDAADLHLRMARLQMKLADPVGAEREFRIAVARGGNRAEIIPELGEAMLAQGENKEALVIVPQRGPTPGLTARNLLVRAAAQLALGDTSAAGATLAEARHTVPDALQTPLIAARLAAARGDFAGTEAAADAVLQRDPGQIDALLIKGQLLAARHDRPAATAVAARAVASAPFSAQARVFYAGLLMDNNEDAQAAAQVDAVLANQPRFLDALFLHGLLRAKAGRLDDAASEMHALEAATSRMPQVLLTQATIAARLNRPQTAADYARRYHALIPGDHAGTLVLARALLAMDRPEEARALLAPAVVAGHDDPETLDLLGRAYAAVGDGRTAAGIFAKASEGAPDNAGIMGDLGIAQMQAGNPADAAATLSRALTLSPDLHTASEALVAAFLDLNQPQQAEQALDRLRQAGGTNETVAVLGAMIKVRQLDFAGAEAALTEARRLYPASTGVRLNLARLLAAQGRRSAALAHLNDMLSRDPGNLPVLNTELQLLAQDRDLQAAIHVLEAARRVRPDNGALAASLGDALVAAGSPEKAVSTLKSARFAAPASVPLLSALARAEAAIQDSDAEATWHEVLALAPTNRAAISALLEARLATNDPDGARLVLRNAMDASPGDLGLMTTAVAVENRLAGPDAALRLAAALRQQPDTLPWSTVLAGDLLMRLNRPAEAAQAYATGQPASFPALGVRRAVALARAGNLAAATDVLQALLQQDAGNVDALQALAQLDIAAGRLPDAQAHLEAVLAQAPDNPLALNNLAWVYAERSDPRARATAQRAYLAAPTPDAADTLGWIMVKNGDAKNALPLLRQSNEKQPGRPTVQYHLAVALNDAGQAEAAAQVLDPLVQNPRAFKEKDDARKLLATLPR